MKHLTKTEKLMEFVFTCKIKAMTYSNEMDLVSIGFKSGRIESYMVNIELEKDHDDEEEMDNEESK